MSNILNGFKNHPTLDILDEVKKEIKTSIVKEEIQKKNLVNKFSRLLNESIDEQELANLLFDRLEKRYPDIVSRYGDELVADTIANVVELNHNLEKLDNNDINALVRKIFNILENFASDDLTEGQIYAKGGGYGEGHRWYIPKDNLGEDLNEDLRKWFKEKWVRFGPDGKIRGACARGSKSEGKPKCLPQAKAHALGKKGRKYAASKKRREDPNPERRGPAKNVATKKKSNESMAADSLNEIDRRGILKGIGAGALGMTGIGAYQALNTNSEQDLGKKITDRQDLQKYLDLQKELKYLMKIGGDHQGNPFRKLAAEKSQELENFKKMLMQKYKVQLDELKCWPGYTRVKGIPAGKLGSCKKKTYEQLINEDMQNLSERLGGLDIVKIFGNVIHLFVKGITDEAKEEKQETSLMLQSVKKTYKGEPLSEEEKKQMVDQWRDLLGYGLVAISAGVLAASAGADPVTTGSAAFLVGSYKKAIWDWIRNKSLFYIIEFCRRFGIDLISKISQAIGEVVGPKKGPEDELYKKHAGGAMYESCPHCKGPLVEFSQLSEKKDACYYKVKSRYKVWPSAYASGALVKCRKKGASNWGTGGKKNEGMVMGVSSDASSAGSKVQGEAKNPQQQAAIAIAMKKAGKKPKGESAIMKGLVDETLGLQYPGTYEQETDMIKKKGSYRITAMTNEEQIEEKWSEKYKRSIDCNNPKGFSQRAHCQGRTKK